MSPPMMEICYLFSEIKLNITCQICHKITKVGSQAPKNQTVPELPFFVSLCLCYDIQYIIG